MRERRTVEIRSGKRGGRKDQRVGVQFSFWGSRCTSFQQTSVYSDVKELVSNEALAQLLSCLLVGSGPVVFFFYPHEHFPHTHTEK